MVDCNRSRLPKYFAFGLIVSTAQDTKLALISPGRNVDPFQSLVPNMRFPQSDNSLDLPFSLRLWCE